MTNPTPIASSDDRPAWLAARRGGVTATDLASYGNGTAAALKRIVADKRGEVADWQGNRSTRHGNEREPLILEWIETMSRGGAFGSGALVATHGLYGGKDPRHLATPDGIAEDFDFFRELVEVKTTVKPLDAIPSDYMRQILWQQHVLGADRTLFVWELRDENFQPVDLEPEWQWVKRDQAAIDVLVENAAKILAYIDGEAPLPPVDIDRKITRYLRLQAKRDAINADLSEIETWLRERAGDKPLTVLGTLGDLSIGAPSTQKRFDSTAFKTAQPETYGQFQKTIAVKPRFQINPVEAGPAAEDTNAQEAAA